MKIKYDDGGRSTYFGGSSVGDCVSRSYAIATGRDYKEAHDELFNAAKTAPDPRHRRTPRTGVHKSVYAPIFERAGGIWTPTMKIGTGAVVHLREGEVPSEGRYIVRLSRHLCAVIDGVIHDTHDPSRGGTRCVYGHWFFGPA